MLFDGAITHKLEDWQTLNKEARRLQSKRAAEKLNEGEPEDERRATAEVASSSDRSNSSQTNQTTDEQKRQFCNLEIGAIVIREQSVPKRMWVKEKEETANDKVQLSSDQCPTNEQQQERDFYKRTAAAAALTKTDGEVWVNWQQCRDFSEVCRAAVRLSRNVDVNWQFPSHNIGPTH